MFIHRLDSFLIEVKSTEKGTKLTGQGQLHHCRLRIHYATDIIWMAIRGASPRYLSIGKKFNGDPSYRFGEAIELTKKARSPPQHLSSELYQYSYSNHA